MQSPCQWFGTKPTNETCNFFSTQVINVLVWVSSTAVSKRKAFPLSIKIKPLDDTMPNDPMLARDT